MSNRVTGYGVGAAQIKLAPVPVTNNGVPTSDTAYIFGQLIKDKVSGDWYVYSGGSVFDLIASSAGAIVSIAGTANQITANTVAGVTTLSIPSTFIAPGTVTATTSLTTNTQLSSAVGSTVSLYANTTTGSVVLGGGLTTGSLTLGSTSSSSTTTVRSGTGGIILSGIVTFNEAVSSTANATAELFNNVDTGIITIGSGLTTGSITIGNTASSSTTTIQSGSGGVVISSPINAGSAGATVNLFDDITTGQVNIAPNLAGGVVEIGQASGIITFSAGGISVYTSISANSVPVYTESVYALGDAGGLGTAVGLTNVTNEAVDTGAGTIVMCGPTARVSTGFLKIYEPGGNPRYIPYFTTITG